MHRSTRSSRSLRMLVAAALVVVLSGLGGCGMDAQTLQSYTPAHGVNIDEGFLKVRNLLPASSDSGGRCSASVSPISRPAAWSAAACRSGR